MAWLTVTNPAVISAVIAGVVSVITYTASRKKVNAEADSVTVASALSLIGPMREQMVDLEERLHALEEVNVSQAARIRHLEKGVTLLQTQLVVLGETPVFVLPPRLGPNVINKDVPDFE